jgi:formylmethanofuran dehydrogenase subunit B
MIYEWKCEVCGEICDIQRSVADMDMGPSDNEAACDCGVGNYNRIISKSNVPFETLRDRGVFDRTHWKGRQN